MAAYRPSRRRFAAWARQEPTLAGLNWESLQTELLDRQIDHDRKDDLLAALVRIARCDRDAVLALAACLRPGLHVEARKLIRILGPDEAWAEILTGLCARVATYDLARRPRKIARNLILDALRPLRRAVDDHIERVTATCELTADHHPTVEPEGLPATTILALAADAGVIAPLDAALIAATRLGGTQLKEAAGLAGIDYEVAKKRRQRAEPALAHWWLHSDTTPTGTAPHRQLSYRCAHQPQDDATRPSRTLGTPPTGTAVYPPGVPTPWHYQYQRPQPPRLGASPIQSPTHKSGGLDSLHRPGQIWFEPPDQRVMFSCLDLLRGGGDPHLERQ